jgi:hypothetical protein
VDEYTVLDYANAMRFLWLSKIRYDLDDGSGQLGVVLPFLSLAALGVWKGQGCGGFICTDQARALGP